MAVRTACAAPAQFHGHFGAVSMHPAYQIGQRGNMGVAPQAHGAVSLFLSPAIGMSHDNQTHAAFCPFFIEAVERAADRALRPRAPRGDGSENKAVVQFHGADPPRCEQFFQCHNFSRTYAEGTARQQGRAQTDDKISGQANRGAARRAWENGEPACVRRGRLSLPSPRHCVSYLGCRAHYADQRCRHSAMTFPSSLRTVRNLSLSRGLVNV